MTFNPTRRAVLGAALGMTVSACDGGDDPTSATGAPTTTPGAASPLARALTSAASPAGGSGMKGGVNIAGLEFNAGALPGTANVDYAPPDPAEIAYYHSRGAKTLRLPFLWERLQPSLGGPLDTAYAALIDAAVDQAKQLGMSVLLDAHQYGRRAQGGQSFVIGETATVTSMHFASFWNAVAKRYASSPVIFNLINEPHDQDGKTLVSVQNEAISAIRSAGARQLVLASGTAWSGAGSWVSSGNGDLLLAISDSANNVAFDVHQYLDADSSGTSGTCAPNASARLASFTAWARQHGKRAMLGEFAAAADGGCLNQLSAMLRHMGDNSEVWAGWTWWAGGPWWPSTYPFTLRPVSLSNPIDRPQMSLLQSAW